MTTTRNYDNLNRLTSIGTVDYQGNALGSFEYTYNALNQRSQTTAADGTYWTYGYDDLGQVISGQKYWSNGTAVEGQGFGYTFDGNGNRTAATINGHSATYSPTSIDQYTQRTVPGYVDVSGTALSAATVLVNGTATDRQGSYYFEELSAPNTAAPVFTTVTAQATLSGSTNTLTGHVYTPQTPEAFSYDTDGNLTQDGRWQYTWDAENRLIEMTPISTVPAGAKKTLQFTYDYLGRRISKSAATWNTSTGAYRTAVETRFIYDGWNLAAETDSTGKLLRNYVWGTDLSGTPQGAGGVGGLLMVTNAGPTPGQTHTYFPTYDGNGNVISLIKSTDAISRASYEYGPFGEVLRQSGTYSTTNPFRFSTKYEDEETGLDYYGSRFYSPITGRWSSRDPFEEGGGINLYGLVGNSPIDYMDTLGFCPFIAVSASKVTGPTYHATVTYFTGDAVPTLKKLYSGDDLINKGAKPEASVELERSPAYGMRKTNDWKVWGRSNSFMRALHSLTGGPDWHVDRVGISYILYGDGYGGDGAVAVYLGTDDQVLAKWRNIMQIAKSYSWASQSMDRPDNFPNSLYGDPSNMMGYTANNSNTFARYVLDNSGLDSDLNTLLDGWFPGNWTPSNPTNWWPGQTPVPWNAPMPPMPK